MLLPRHININLSKHVSLAFGQPEISMYRRLFDTVYRILRSSSDAIFCPFWTNVGRYFDGCRKLWRTIVPVHFSTLLTIGTVFFPSHRKGLRTLQPDTPLKKSCLGDFPALGELPRIPKIPLTQFWHNERETCFDILVLICKRQFQDGKLHGYYMSLLKFMLSLCPL